MKKEYLNPQPTQENPVIVDNYPWGFRLKTKVRYWVETRKGHGDRFVKQTLNPKTNKWCNPKRGTYSDLILVYRDTENGYIEHSVMASHWDTDTIQEDITKIRDTGVTLNELQEIMLKELKALKETRKHFTVEIKQEQFKHKITGEIRDTVPIFEMDDYEKVDDNTEEQKEVKKNIGRLHAYNRHKEGL